MASDRHHRDTLKKQRSRRDGVCDNVRLFKEMLAHKGKRVAILMEGDSWFAYPRQYLLFGRPSNVSDHLFAHIRKHHYGIITCLAKNGDEAAEMSQPPGSLAVKSVLRSHGRDIDVFLISAGGNDFVSKNLLKFLPRFAGQTSASQCIDWPAFDEIMNLIESRYTVLLDYCRFNLPKLKIVTHCYDYLKPENRGFKLFSFKINGPWIHKYFAMQGIPEHLREAIVVELLNRFKAMLDRLEAKYPGHFFVVDTFNTLTPGNRDDWADEMHPSSAGFRRITTKIVDRIRAVDHRIPAF